MANISKNKKNKKVPQAVAAKQTAPVVTLNEDPRVLWSMSHAPSLDQNSSIMKMLPAIFFTAFIILIVRMVPYTRPMDQFYWTAGQESMTDFFSYGKMVALLCCAGLVLLMLLFQVVTQSMVIKRTKVYIPMLIYCAFVILSYVTSDYKDFALLGYNERFEGTLPLLAYMVILFFIINSVNGEKNVRWMMYGLVISAIILSLLGISQALDMDFFRTNIGQKLLVPNYELESGMTAWEAIDAATEKGELLLEFTFNNREIYQTVYNINYVSFYLTLLLPLFGMMFIRSVNLGKEEVVWKKAGWAVMFALVLYNLIGSASAGGFLGMGAVVLLALVLLNKKILDWKKPVAMLLIITAIVGGLTVDRWWPQISGAVQGVIGTSHAAGEEEETEELTRGRIDYIRTEDNYVDFSINGNAFSIVVLEEEDGSSFILEDADGKQLPMSPTEVSGVYSINDDRFRDYATVAYTSHEGMFYVIVGTQGQDWYFAVTDDGMYYRNGFGNLIELNDVEHIGFEGNMSFGSGRGYIWSRTIPMMKDTVLLGHGADTYAIHFPHYDYVGKYNDFNDDNVDIIVDKPHCMYMGAWIGTGGVSVIALVALFAIYLFQSIKLYAKKSFVENDYLSFTGVGIMFSVVGFLVAGLVNDSTVSVMAMFYGILGMGIAINMILSHREKNAPVVEAVE